MVLLLDVGNTAITYGFYQGARMHHFGSCLYSEIPKIINKCFKNGANNNLDVLISSVVPKITQKISKAIPENARFLIAGKDLPIPVKHRYKKGERLGIDRLVNIYGAIRIYGTPLLMLDYGTAITADYVSKTGIFEGGMIIPGPEVAFQALTARAALLPKKVRLPEKASSFLGRTTYDCMSSGILEAYGAMTDGLIERFRARYGKKIRVIATGGFASHLKSYVTGFHVLDPQHSIKSLLLLYKSSRLSK